MNDQENEDKIFRNSSQSSKLSIENYNQPLLDPTGPTNPSVMPQVLHTEPGQEKKLKSKKHPSFVVGDDHMKKSSSVVVDCLPDIPKPYLDDPHGNYLSLQTPLVHPSSKQSLVLPTTFNQDPNCVRRMSMSLGVPLSTGYLYKNKELQQFQPKKNNSPVDSENENDDSQWKRKFSSKKHHRRRTRRVCNKSGYANVKYKNISEKRRRYVYDIYTTLVDARWTTGLFLFSMSFYISWVFYGAIYYIICYIHGDLEENHLPDKQAESNWTPCIQMIDGFSAAFLFSLETQHTIGYGSRQTTTECVAAMIVMTTQSIVGCLIQAFMVGLIFAKLSAPVNRAKTVVFSKNAVICQRDKKLVLLFRVGDMRHDSFIIGAQLSAKLIKRHITQEGEMYHDVTPIEITPDSTDEPCIFLIWPLTVVHVINEDSPFYNLSAPEFASDKFEIHISFEGTIESTSMTFQARTSYLPEEILWGHRFEPLMIYRKDTNKYQINFAAFNSTYEVDTPVCSARDLKNFFDTQERQRRIQRSKSHSNPPKIKFSASSESACPMQYTTTPTFAEPDQFSTDMSAREESSYNTEDSS